MSAKIVKIRGSEITYPYYPGDPKCEYCKGTYAVDHVIFQVILKNDQTVKTCSVCLYENILEHSPEINKIINIGEWS